MLNISVSATVTQCEDVCSFLEIFAYKVWDQYKVYIWVPFVYAIFVRIARVQLWVLRGNAAVVLKSCPPLSSLDRATLRLFSVATANCHRACTRAYKSHCWQAMHLSLRMSAQASWPSNCFKTGGPTMKSNFSYLRGLKLNSPKAGITFCSYRPPCFSTRQGVVLTYST